ncbi:MAG: hypothetical protein WC382_10680 [Methanoregulaceae archaeon]
MKKANEQSRPWLPGDREHSRCTSPIMAYRIGTSPATPGVRSTP